MDRGISEVKMRDKSWINERREWREVGEERRAMEWDYVSCVCVSDFPTLRFDNNVFKIMSQLPSSSSSSLSVSPPSDSLSLATPSLF